MTPTSVLVFYRLSLVGSLSGTSIVGPLSVLGLRPLFRFTSLYTELNRPVSYIGLRARALNVGYRTIDSSTLCPLNRPHARDLVRYLANRSSYRLSCRLLCHMVDHTPLRMSTTNFCCRVQQPSVNSIHNPRSALLVTQDYGNYYSR